MSDEPALADFPKRSTDKLRFSDTDRQGHVNNAVFATFLETGRVEILYDSGSPIAAEAGEFVIARLGLEFRAEIRWPGSVTIGTRVAAVGRSSVTLSQAIFQDGRCAALAETVIVQIDRQSRRALALSPQAAERLRGLMG
ncbi:thioesterase family protein [Aurantimonas sp. VKM B-3413]|uniref:acyl-CoA thioesterase n=1 Tax=Aurantimonas sp. VKM B-3413 TaxID=2779401 RepID=UPI001E588688|nr:thioesterase family protein [Aurantimonas sp. VKM B-3413]MCB8837633.1 acyl-CoA thioesterase [Aurantimonas sp. VKM B-3413]